MSAADELKRLIAESIPNDARFHCRDTYLRNHAADFVALIEAAEAIVDSYEPERYVALRDAIKPFTKGPK